MPSVRIFITILFATCVLLGVGVAGAETAGNDMIYWGSHGLAIPYRWAGEPSSLNVSEVVLYVSQDRGGSWQKVVSAAPQVQSFQYQAAGDGEFWFALRTFDRYGGHQPPGPLTPEMRVVVDTVSPIAPKVEADLRDGLLVARIRAEDRGGIDLASVRLYAQLPNEPSWTPVVLKPTSGPNIASQAASQVSMEGRLNIPQGTQQVALRASVADRAGNRTETGATASQASLAAPRGPWLSSPASEAITPRDTRARTQLNPFGTQDQTSKATDTSALARHTRAPSSPSQPWPEDSAPTQRFVANARQRDTSDPFHTASFGSTPGPLTNRRDKPSRERLSRSVGSTRFEFDYELEKSGRWGVASVELWGTPDDGRSWRRFAIDSDRQSPIHVTVPGEGEYGFQILVEPVGGIEPAPPRPGDRPEVTVRVDLTTPRVLLRRAEQGEGYLADRLDIQWSVTEEYPGDEPIDLFYSNRKSGPWVPVAMGLDDSGRYAWRLQRHLPDRLYLRVEARDAAGNVGSAVTPEPLAIDLPRAVGTLRGVRSLGLP